ncbi:hypothetical protein PVAND_005332 [Polypedilum vanderplanki]|uniref:BTB domain-containing protein n=1 Tax=Polypedilum vanderplanki TaxID=319348 RepID=A0A9J6C0T2_POLVA|nr:hypothetical protein PVAND_005332 [Polypedilum vanderplanki]
MKIEISGKVDFKQNIQDAFENNWLICIDGKKSEFSFESDEIDPYEVVTYSGSIILKPKKEGILRKAEQIKMFIEMKNHENFSFVTTDLIHHDGGVFHFLTPPKRCFASTFILHIEIPKLKDVELSNSKDHLKKLLQTGEHADVIIKTTGNDIPVHKFMLTRYEHFDQMFKSDIQEARIGIVKTRHDYELMFELMKYIYYEECNLDKFAIDLLTVSDEYNIVDLFNLCENFLIKSITMDNFFDVALIVIANERLKKLKKEIIKFFSENQIEIITTEKWCEFAEKYPRHAMDYMEIQAHNAYKKMRLSHMDDV